MPFPEMQKDAGGREKDVVVGDKHKNQWDWATQGAPDNTGITS